MECNLNFYAMVKDVLIEQDKSFEDLENAQIIPRRSFYQFKACTPYLSAVIKIANFLQVSLDYLTGRSTKNVYKKYCEDQCGFYNKLTSFLSSSNISQSKLSRDLSISRPNFTYWKQGTLPKLETLITLSNYLNCSIDDLLDVE